MKDLTVGNEGQLIFKFALPMLLGNVFQQLYNIIDSLIVGNSLGKEALSAVGASFPIIFALLALTIGITMGSSIIISQYFGAKDFEKVKLTIDTTFIFLAIASIIISVVGILSSEYIFRLINLPENIIPQATLFFDIYLGGTILLFGYNGTSAILRGLGDSKTPLYFLIIAVVLNIILCILFVLVFQWGVAGAAISTVIAYGVSFFSLVIYLNKTHEIVKFSFTKMKFNKEIFVKCLKIGLPSGLQQTFVALGMMALYGIVNKHGTDTIAAFTVAGRIDSFAMLPAMNFAMAFTTFVGQNIGANKPERVKKGLWATIWMTGIISLFFTLTVLLFSKTLMSFFTPESEVIRIGARYLIIVGVFYIVFSTMFVVNGVFRGAGDTLIPMFITLFSLWAIRIPLSYFLSQKYGEDGIWWGIPLAWICGMVFSLIYYFFGNWKSKSVVKHSKTNL